MVTNVINACHYWVRLLEHSEQGTRTSHRNDFVKLELKLNIHFSKPQNKIKCGMFLCFLVLLLVSVVLMTSYLTLTRPTLQSRFWARSVFTRILNTASTGWCSDSSNIFSRAEAANLGFYTRQISSSGVRNILTYPGPLSGPQSPRALSPWLLYNHAISRDQTVRKLFLATVLVW